MFFRKKTTRIKTTRTDKDKNSRGNKDKDNPLNDISLLSKQITTDYDLFNKEILKNRIEIQKLYSQYGTLAKNIKEYKKDVMFLSQVGAILAFLYASILTVLVFR